MKPLMDQPKRKEKEADQALNLQRAHMTIHLKRNQKDEEDGFD
jgi:hypothetical protein